jgi:hypothetical protein
MKSVLFLILSLLTPIIGFTQWDNIIENIDTTGTINLTNSSWSNTLIRNCTIHNTGTGNDGIFLRDVKNVRIENCTIYDIDGQAGIRFSISGNGTDSVQIINNTLYNLAENGINAPQRSQNSTPLNQDHLEIIGNTIYNSGLGSSNGLHHAIYCQAADYTIKNNIIFGIRDGNGISVRSSGILSGNTVSGESKANKPAMRYFSDHYTGESDTLLIENNILYNDSSNAHSLDIFDLANLYQNSSGNNHVVKNFNIRFNTVVSFYFNKYALRISDDYDQNDYSIQTDGNLFLNTANVGNCLSVPTNTIQNYNLLTTSITNFQSNTAPYNFHLADNHEAVGHVGGNTNNYPTNDIDGELRLIGFLDAGADQYSLITATQELKKEILITIYPNPVKNNNEIIVSSKTGIKTIKILSSIGQLIFNEDYPSNSRSEIIDLSQIMSVKGLYYVLVDNNKTIPLVIN